MPSAVLINTRNCNKGNSSKRMCLNSQLVKLWWYRWVYLCLAIMCLKDLGIQEENDSINYEKFFNQCFSIYMKENETQSWNILKKKIKCCSGIHLCLILSPRKNRKPLTASILLTVEHEQPESNHFSNVHTFLFF